LLGRWFDNGTELELFGGQNLIGFTITPDAANNRYDIVPAARLETLSSNMTGSPYAAPTGDYSTPGGMSIDFGPADAGDTFVIFGSVNFATAEAARDISCNVTVNGTPVRTITGVPVPEDQTAVMYFHVAHVLASAGAAVFEAEFLASDADVEGISGTITVLRMPA
jgi:hypothetical protein